MRTQSVSKLLYLAVWLLVSPGLLFAQQDSLPGSSLPPQGGFLVSTPPANSDTVITVTKLPYPEARVADPPVREGLAPSLLAPSHLDPALDTTGTLDYESCIHNRHTLQLTADLTTLQESKKGAWLKYLPTVSVGLAPALRVREGLAPSQSLSPTLSIGLNSSLIYQSHREKQQRKATREAIIKQNKLREATEIAQLHRLQRRLQTEIDKLNLQSGVADIDRQLYTLYKKTIRKSRHFSRRIPPQAQGIFVTRTPQSRPVEPHPIASVPGRRPRRMHRNSARPRKFFNFFSTRQ